VSLLYPLRYLCLLLRRLQDNYVLQLPMAGVPPPHSLDIRQLILTNKSPAPWRDPSFFNKFQGRNDLLDYAAAKGIPVASTKAKVHI
jgi:hypothetical protein